MLFNQILMISFCFFFPLLPLKINSETKTGKVDCFLIYMFFIVQSRRFEWVILPRNDSILVTQMQEGGSYRWTRYFDNQPVIRHIIKVVK